jgi:hypothetical protein
LVHADSPGTISLVFQKHCQIKIGKQFLPSAPDGVSVMLFGLIQFTDMMVHVTKINVRLNHVRL